VGFFFDHSRTGDHEQWRAGAELQRSDLNLFCFVHCDAS